MMYIIWNIWNNSSDLIGWTQLQIGKTSEKNGEHVASGCKETPLDADPLVRASVATRPKGCKKSTQTYRMWKA